MMSLEYVFWVSRALFFGSGVRRDRNIARLEKFGEHHLTGP